MALALPSSSILTLAELREFLGASGGGRDELMKAGILAATGALESYLDRRAKYRAPAAVSGGADIVAAVALVETTTTTLTIAAQPAAARTLKLKIICPASQITAGTVTVTGTVAGVAGTVETFDVVDGYQQDGVLFFTALSAITYTGMTGVDTSYDTIRVGSSLGYTEDHSTIASGDLRPLEWPIQSVASVNEDSTRAFASTTLLVADTDYGIRKGGAEERGRLYRLSDSLPYSWAAYWRGLRLIYSGGYTAAGVPWLIKDVCRHLAALIYQDSSPGTGGARLGVISGSDASGNWTRYAPSALSTGQREQLFGLRRFNLCETGERDFDLESA